MASSLEPRSGLKYGWTLGESGWNGEMDANLLFIGRFLTHLSIKGRDLTVPPATPAAGDTYIPAVSSNGAWTGLAGKVVVWTGAAWAVGTPRVGWQAFVEDESKLIVYKAAGWSAGIAV